MIESRKVKEITSSLRLMKNRVSKSTSQNGFLGTVSRSFTIQWSSLSYSNLAIAYYWEGASISSTTAESD